MRRFPSAPTMYVLQTLDAFNVAGSRASMEPRERAVGVRYRIAGLIRREQKEVEITPARLRV